MAEAAIVGASAAVINALLHIHLMALASLSMAAAAVQLPSAEAPHMVVVSGSRSHLCTAPFMLPSRT